MNRVLFDEYWMEAGPVSKLEVVITKDLWPTAHELPVLERRPYSAGRLPEPEAPKILNMYIVTYDD